MICFDCQGEGKSVKFLPFLSHHKYTKEQLEQMMVCTRCNGTGQIHDDATDWVVFGKVLRQYRLSQEMTIREVCNKTGWNVVAYSRQEWGKDKPDLDLFKQITGREYDKGLLINER